MRKIFTILVLLWGSCTQRSIQKPAEAAPVVASQDQVRAKAKPPLRRYTSDLNMNVSSCFMADDIATTYSGCGGCDTLRFKAGGVFTGSIGCDILLNGTWYIDGDKLKGTFSKTTSCAHTIPFDKTNDPKWIEEHCAEIERPTAKKGNFTLRRRGDGVITVFFSGYNAPILDGKLYYMEPD